MRQKLDAPAFLIVFPVSMLSGTLLMSWMTYLTAYILRQSGNGLLTANIDVMLFCFLFIAIILMRLRKRIPAYIRGLFRNTKFIDIAVVIAVIALSSFVSIHSFHYGDGAFKVGVSVHSDFATHLDMIRSFSRGGNFPTSYSHFAGEDIKYHFMFQFLAGNLEFLGMRLDTAFNVPSIIFFSNACIMIYLLAIKLFGARPVGVLSVIFFLFRSGTAFFKFAGELQGKWGDILKALKSNRAFIGYTANENWGLYNINVYANQRHLAFGLCMILFAIMMFLPGVFEMAEKTSDESDIKRRLRAFFLEKEAWLPSKYSLPVFTGLIIGLTGFYNGACVIGCLLVLFFMAVFSLRRLEYLITAVISVIIVNIQTRFFMEESSFFLRWDPGYLSDTRTFFGTCEFIYTLLGAFLSLTIVSFAVHSRTYRRILLAFISPILFALMFQLTKDTSVNHKYIMIGCMLGDVFIASLISLMFRKKDVVVKAAAVLCVILMTATGLYDFYVFNSLNAESNGGVISFYEDDPVTVWIMDNTDPRDIFLSYYYSLSKETIAGAMLYYGWPYYAWSAGYDTDYRAEQVKLMYEASSSEDLDELCRKNNISYIIVDHAVRTSDDYSVREDVISGTYECVFTADGGEWAENIYDTAKPVLR